MRLPRYVPWRFDFVEAIKSVLIWTCGIIEFSILIALIMAVFFVLASTTKSALSHSWYPSDCCSGNDCAPVPSKRVHIVTGGYLIDGRHFVFESQTRISPDKQYHGCFPTAAILRCFFAPKPSM